MGILEKIKLLANEQALTLAELERKLDFSNGSLRKWDTSAPSGDKIEKVADYFNVSVDYLLGRESYEIMKLNQARKDFTENLIEDDEKQALVMFRKETDGMSEEEKERFNKALAGMMQTARNLIKDDTLWK
ncbi:TPA: helix-turn-helix transcriptional regulator [Streptococcus suis]|uniref:helix-turn-helix domain-containing protein n=1 Tax=Streptococcus suis TaxID=1307 RepID=UPI001555D07A|nr:helix-turn-helix domain-containing protein [Streptococcus suis]MDY7593861.1 helix-turn-helix transcriptional regulator [Streptococcus suis]NQQ29868.1 helix-turn-helix transcriptional regulator [Streptococcus suis]HEL2254777.1 helix-turn-helix transcriptional regulator [Streptococcus suis]HEL2407275.1 helix-turn-helix transcriptional regulator [Streptococcus suis]HEM5553924.1 helix-turn-helix transcriptional regulator [Streptococcus suis]